MPKIEIDLDELFPESQYDPEIDEVRPVGLRDLVIRAAADKLVTQYGREAQTAIGHVINEVVTQQVRSVVMQAMAQPIQRTTRWGEPTGAATTILEIVREKLDEFVTAKPTRRDEFNGRRNAANNLTELLEDIVRAAMTRELSGAVKEARLTVAAKVQEILATELPKALAR
jgi:uncharacterized NAD(P)/FAD-binding protein YdhS